MDQNVLELITASLDQAGGMQIDNQIAPQSLVEIRLEVIWGCDGGEGVAGEDLSNNRRLLQQSTDLLGQAVEARRDQRLDRRRWRADRGRCRSPVTVFWTDLPRFKQHLHEFLDKEWISGGLAADNGVNAFGKEIRLQQSGHHPARFLWAERLEVDGGGVRGRAAPLRSQIEEFWASE